MPVIWKMLIPAVFADDLHGGRPNDHVLYFVEFQM
jgi:hypothetical protein